MKYLRWIACAAAISATFCSSPVLRAENAPPVAGADRNIKQAFTLPFKEYKISFPTMGVIKEVRVKEGDMIRKGDMVMKQDDSEDRAELRLLELDVNEYPIQAAEAKLRAAESEFQAKDRMKAQGAGSDLEWERARAERDVAKVQIEASKQELKQKEAKRDKQTIHVTNMTLLAPTDGVVKELINDIGSNIDPTKPVVTVVENNPLLVEVQVPALASLQVKKGETLRVSYDKKTWKDASVSFLSPQADAGSGMRMIRLELPNPNGDPSGLQVFVELSDKLLAAADGK
ncbi:MAG: cation efflux system [Phycisphaerales bacterium]|nr:cation efflux system [Phycisphaerales bacterium]